MGLQSDLPRALSIGPNIPVKVPCIPCDDWNTVFSFGCTNPSQAIRFQVLSKNAKSNGGLFAFFIIFYLLWDCSTYSEVKINDVLGEHDNITFIVHI